MILEPKSVIGDCLETAFGLPKYLDIIMTAKLGGSFATPEFRTMYNSYYVVQRKKPLWYDCYYSLMEEQAKKARTFEGLLRELLPFGAIDVSFSSKLLSTIDPSRPIWDQYVLKSLGMYSEWQSFSGKSKETRIQKAINLYEKIECWYADFLDSENGKACIAQFDAALPKYASLLSDVKKVDFMLYSKR